MKLRLPNALLVALMAAAVAPTMAVTSSTTTYGSITFNGDIWTWNNAGDETSVSSADSQYTKYNSNPTVTYAGNADITDVGKFYNYFFNASESAYVGNTLRFSGATSNIRLNTDWTTYVWVGGIITESGDYTYTLGRDGNTNFKLKGTGDVNMLINSSFTLKTGATQGSIAVDKGGSWTVASGKTLTLSSAAISISSGQTVNFAGSGSGDTVGKLALVGAFTNAGTLAVNSGTMTSSSTFTNNGTLTIGKTGDSATSGTVTLSGAYSGTGSVTVNSGSTLTFAGGDTISGAITNNGTLKFGSSTTINSTITNSGTLNLGSAVSFNGKIANSGTINAATGGTTMTISDVSGLTLSDYSTLSNGTNGYYTKANATVVTGTTDLENITWKQGDTELTYTNGVVGLTLTGGLYYVNEGDVSISGANGATGYQMAANTTLTFTGDTTVSGDITTKNNAADNSTRAITVNKGVAVQAANITNSWGWAKLDVDGTLNVTGTLKLAYITGDLGTKNNCVTGDGSITAATLVAANWGKYLVDVETLAATTVTMQESATMQIDSDSATLGTVNANIGTLSFTGDAASVSNVLYSNGAGTINVGDGTNKTVLTATRVQLGDNSSSGNDSTLNVNACSVLKVTGSDADSGSNIYKNTGLILGEWESSTTANINGLFLSENASLQPGDKGFTLNIGSDGVMAVRGIGTWGCNKSGKKQTQAINLNGGKLLFGDRALNGYHNTAMTLTLTGGTIGTYYSNTTEGAADLSIGVNATLSSGTTTTLESNLYTVDFTKNEVTAGSTAADIAVSGDLSGEGALKVTGAGTVTLSGANTYSGGTKIAGSSVVASSTSAYGTGAVTVSGTSSLSGTATIGTSTKAANLNIGYWNSGSSASATAKLSGNTTVTGETKVIMTSTAEVSGTLNSKGTLTIGSAKDAVSHLKVTDGAAENTTTLVDIYSADTSNAVTIENGTTVSYVAASGDDVAYGQIAGGTVNNAVMALAEASSLKLTDVTLQNTIITGTAAPTVAATNITFNGGTVTLGTADASVDGGYAHNGTLTASNVTVSDNSTLNANLRVSGAMTFGGKLEMGCSVNFTSATTITLSDSMAADVWKNGKTAVLTSVESYDGLANTNFNGKALEAVSDGEGTGTYTIYAMTPEPATTTLSLLALTGLCARRRRH